MEKLHIAVFGISDVKGGVEQHFLNYFRNINREKIQYHIFAPFEKLAYEETFLDLGAKVYHIPKRSAHPWMHYAAVYRIMKGLPQIDIVHCHVGSAEYCFPLILGKLLGIRIRIAHSHGTHPEGGCIHYLMHYIGKPILNFFSNYNLACSKAAGRWLFYSHKKVDIVLNAIEIDQFEYNTKLRVQLREKYGLENMIVLGHVGRFCEAKNHIFIMEIISALMKNNENVVLMLVGEGELQDKIKKIVIEKNLQDHVKFIGFQEKVSDFYNIFDAFILPSLFEGFPVSVIEAAANGLPCFLSNTITNELDDYFGDIYYLPLDDVHIWETRLKSVEIRNNTIRQKQNMNFDIKLAALKLEKFYFAISNSESR